MELEKIAASASFDSSTDKSPLESFTYVKVGRHQNALVKASAVRETEVQRVNSENAPSSSLTIAEKRELENSLCVGGLRDPQAAVAKSWKLRQVGARLRAVLDIHLTTAVTQQFEDEPQSCPFSVAELREVRTAVAKEFNADVSHEGYEAELFGALLKTADDPDAATIYDWLKFGFPLGVKCKIKNNGVFPATDEVSAAIQASKTIGTLASDWSGEARNYTSFAEAGPLAEEELERLVHLGRADKVGSWREVVDLVGQDAVLTPLACIVKVKDGKTKTRLIVDMRRSGINGQVSLFERVVLPRVSDVAKSTMALRQKLCNQDSLEFCSADFSDAFYTLFLRPEERSCVIVKNSANQYFCFRVVGFGVASAPLLWARLCSSIMRVSQAAVAEWEGRVATYVDDPVIVAGGRTRQDRTKVMLVFLVTWMVVGFQLSWPKVQRGLQVNWIGVTLHFVTCDLLQVMLTHEKTAALRAALEELVANPVVSLTKLQNACGVLGWLSSIIPIARPWMGMLYAALAQAKQYTPRRPSTRQRKGLCFRKQLSHAVRWLQYLLGKKSESQTLRHRYVLDHKPLLVYVIECDACPQGMGGVLRLHNKPVLYWHCPILDSDLALLGPGVSRDPSFQTEFEFFALLLSVKKFAEQIAHPFRFFIRADNVSALHSALTYKSSSPLLTRLVAELALEQEVNNRPALEGRHLRGLLNDTADKLSRGEVVDTLLGIPQLHFNRDRTLFRAWPEPE